MYKGWSPRTGSATFACVRSPGCRGQNSFLSFLLCMLLAADLYMQPVQSSSLAVITHIYTNFTYEASYPKTPVCSMALLAVSGCVTASSMLLAGT
jgi:hypothetical protein